MPRLETAKEAKHQDKARLCQPPRIDPHPRGDRAAMKKILVDCRRNGESIRVYDFGLPESLGLTVPPSKQELIDQAKSNPTTERLAFPAWADVEFEVYYP